MTLRGMVCNVVKDALITFLVKAQRRSQRIGIPEKLVDTLCSVAAGLSRGLVFHNEVRLPAGVIRVHDNISEIGRCAARYTDLGFNTIGRVATFHNEPSDGTGTNPLLRVSPVL